MTSEKHNTPLAWKMIYLARRNPTLTPEQFPQAWREHSALGRQCKNVQDRVRSVTQCVRLLDGEIHDASTDYDGLNLLGLRDRESADAIWTDPETLAIMRPDEPRVFDRYVRDFTLVAQEQVLQSGSQGDAVLVGFFKKDSGVTAAEFQSSFGQDSPPWPEVRCTLLNLVEPQRPTGYDFDAILEWWFDDAEALVNAITRKPIHNAMPALHHTVCDNNATVFMATRVSHRRP